MLLHTEDEGEQDLDVLRETLFAVFVKVVFFLHEGCVQAEVDADVAVLLEGRVVELRAEAGDLDRCGLQLPGSVQAFAGDDGLPQLPLHLKLVGGVVVQAFGRFGDGVLCQGLFAGFGTVVEHEDALEDGRLIPSQRDGGRDADAIVAADLAELLQDGDELLRQGSETEVWEPEAEIELICHREIGCAGGGLASCKCLQPRLVCPSEKIVTTMAMGGRRGKAGSISVTRVRRWLLAGVITLLLVLAGLIGYTRWKTRKLLMDLPHRLGADIKSETNGFTWSQSVKGHTIFTIHAAKAIQRENGKTTLHDVAITMYGAPGSNRTDSIRGAEFEYDQPNGVVRAAGDVYLDLAAPTPSVNSVGDVKSEVSAKNAATSDAAPSKPDSPPGNGSKRIQVTTSGLTFLQKLGIAATDQPLHIVYGDMRGSATGADYESDTGTLKLHSAVEMNGMQNRQVIHVRAAAAELDRASQRATLHAGRIATDDNRASGDLMLITLATSGGIDRIHSEGHATLEGKGGMTAQSPKMDAQMGDAGKLHDVLMQGGVQFANTAGSTGSAARAEVHFNLAGVATSANFDGHVRLDQVAPGVERSLTAERLVTAMAPDAAGRMQMREATASGPAMVRTAVSAPAKTGGPSTIHVSTLRGTSLRAVTAQRGGVTYVSEITGTGNTQLVQDDGAGTVRTSSGDELHATLFAPGSSAKDKAKSPTGQVQTAVQVGHVVVTQRSPAKGTQTAGETRATAARAEFDDATGGLILTGSPQVTSPGLQLAADRIVLHQGSGDAEAFGAVRGVYVASGATGKAEEKRPADPVHLLADHATVAGGGSAAKLFGTAGKLARMWSSTAQIEAPVIETDRASGKLFAHAAAGDASAGTVRMLLPVQAGAGKSSLAPTGALRITGGTLVYTPADARGPAHADIGGGVRMDNPGSQLTARSAVATLAATPLQGGGSAATALPSGNLQTVTATGDVHLQQPGRSGTGERLVYTAADQRYELTGTAAVPPKVIDSQRGTLSGTSVIFHGADDSVEVSGQDGHRVRTETEVARPAKGK